MAFSPFARQCIAFARELWSKPSVLWMEVSRALYCWTTLRALYCWTTLPNVKISNALYCWTTLPYVKIAGSSRLYFVVCVN